MGCYTNGARTKCNETTQNAPCSPCDTECPEGIWKTSCIVYTGPDQPDIDVVTNDELNVVIANINDAIAAAAACSFTLTPGSNILIEGAATPVVVECGDDITVATVPITADNGLTKPTDINIQLGGTALGTAPLLHNTFITSDTYTLDLRGTAATYVYKVINSSAGGSAILGQSTGGAGVVAISSSNSGIYASSTTGHGGDFASTSASAIDGICSSTNIAITPCTLTGYVASNVVRNILSLGTQHTGASGVGIGTAILFAAKTASGGAEPSGRVGFVLTDVTASAPVGKFEVYCSNGSSTPVRKLAVAGDGLLTLDGYGSAGKAYADDAAAGVGGLTTGEIYQTSGAGAAPLNVAGILMIKQ